MGWSFNKHVPTVGEQVAPSDWQKPTPAELAMTLPDEPVRETREEFVDRLVEIGADTRFFAPPDVGSGAAQMPPGKA